jgi:hypothetical protein
MDRSRDWQAACVSRPASALGPRDGGHEAGPPGPQHPLRRARVARPARASPATRRGNAGPSGRSALPPGRSSSLSQRLRPSGGSAEGDRGGDQLTADDLLVPSPRLHRPAPPLLGFPPLSVAACCLGYRCDRQAWPGGRLEATAVGSFPAGPGVLLRALRTFKAADAVDPAC